MPSKLEQLQLQFRQKLMQEKEERMIKIHTDNQMKALSKVSKYVVQPSVQRQTVNKKPPAMVSSTQPLHSPVKKGSPGVDRSRPLPPITRDSKTQSKSTNHIHRSPQSSSSSDKSYTTVHDTGRSRSVDLESDSLLGAKVNGRARPGPELNCIVNNVKSASYQQSQAGKRSPEPNFRQRHNQDRRPKVNGKQSLDLDEQQKIVNGVSTCPSPKSSTLGNRTRPQVPNGVTKFRSKPVAPPPRQLPSKAHNGHTRPPVQRGPNANQEQCRHCFRNFNKDRIDKHQSVCAKVSGKRVKVFDATKMRVKGTEAESFVRRAAPSRQPKVSLGAKKSNWKKQHEDFINTIRLAKMAQRHLANGGKLSDLPPPPPSDTSDYVPCPHCGRRFSEGAAQRHIPKCKNILSNKKPATKKRF